MSATIPYTPYWYDPHAEDLAALWGSHPLYGEGKPLDGSHEVAAQRMLTAFYDTTLDQIETRRQLLYSYLQGPFDTGTEDMLTLFRRTLPTSTFMPKVVNNLCIAYNQAPTRTWKNAKGADDQKGTAMLRQVYTQFGADGRLQIAYRKEKNSSGVLLRPYIGGLKSGRTRMQIEILTPDLCRYDTANMLPDVLTQVVKPLIEINSQGKCRTVYEVWEADRHYFTDAIGNDTNYANQSAEDYALGDKNPYGRIPYMIARLVEPDTMQTFGAGLFDVAEANLVANTYALMGHASVLYEAFGHWLGINMDVGAERIKMGFGKATFVEGVEGGTDASLLAPSLTPISTNGQYSNIREYARSYIEQIERGIGLPDSVIVSQGGNPPSGIARMLERAELLEQRATDLPLLKLMEAEFSDLLTLVYNTDVAGKVNSQRIPDSLTLDVAFQEERIIQEPALQFDADVKALLAGVMSASRFCRDHAGKEFDSDDQAVAYLLANQRLVEQIRSGLNGGAPPAETPATTTVPGADIAAPEDVGDQMEDEEPMEIDAKKNGFINNSL